MKNTVKRRNPLHRVLATRKGGAHCRNRSGQRQVGKRELRRELAHY